MTPRKFVDEVVQKCSQGNYVEAVTPSEISFFKWKAFLATYYTKPVKGINSFHVFRFSSDRPGVVFCRPYSTSTTETEVRLAEYGTVFPTKDNIAQLLQPYHLGPNPISAERLEYLKAKVVPRGHEVSDLLAPL
jgi:hypothetical protein